MSIPFLPIHTLSQRLMSKTNRRQLWRQQAGAQAPQGGPVFVSPEDQFRMSLDNLDLRAAQAVELGNHQLITRLEGLEAGLELLAVRVGHAGAHPLAEDLLTAGGLERGDLGRFVLGTGADPGVTDRAGG